MQNLLLFCTLLFFIFSCQESPKQDVVVKGQSVVQLPVNPDKIKGMYTGEFRGSPFSIVLDYVTDKQARGYDRRKGVTRDLSGVVEFSEGKLHLYLVEPGDSRNDGQFHLTVDTSHWKGEGTWKSFITGTEVPFQFRKRWIQKEGGGQVFVDQSSNYIILKPDGSCIFNYQSDTLNSTEPIAIHGRYQKEKNKVTIYWQKNALYPSGKSVFHLFTERAFKSENYTQRSLRGEGQVFSEMVF